ncbi:MAG TPA: ubiquinone/menaquinone biosynthesis methyltransferase [Povalibacter sp.]|nr:ubiquinone/menaquinone biosynthesis methyltransferase [Povalibacter sp.]
MSASRPSEHLNAAEFTASVDDVFGRIASRYDLLCDLFSFWIHRHWKRRVAMLVASQPWQDLLDSASGTGDIVLRVLNRQPGNATRRIVASDISPQMLAIAKRRLAPLAQSVELRQLDAHSMPSVPAASVDLYSISLGLKICNRHAVLREALRVLKPGGRLIVLEASNIPVRWLHQAYLLYMSVCMPFIGWVATGGDASAYRYLLQGIREFPTAEALAEEIRQVGFDNVSFERLSLGIVAIHVAQKPADGARAQSRA